ncbi:DUF7835 family putative zinc beta-ribbon protein [Haladaptatus salinisoli]
MISGDGFSREPYYISKRLDCSTEMRQRMNDA